MRVRRPSSISSALLLALIATTASAAEPADPWRALERLRTELAHSGALGAEFVQSFVPAGFETGDSESGTIALGLPDCLRFDYLDPDPKAFLVCGERAWSWVPGEPRGKRIAIDAEDEIGLDLLLLGSAELATRYRLQASRSDGGGVELAFEPLDPEARLAAGNLTIDAAGSRPLALSWRDREGAVTSFAFRAWRPLGADDRFTPPTAIEWSEAAP